MQRIHTHKIIIMKTTKHGETKRGTMRHAMIPATRGGSRQLDNISNVLEQIMTNNGYCAELIHYLVRKSPKFCNAKLLLDKFVSAAHVPVIWTLKEKFAMKPETYVWENGQCDQAAGELRIQRGHACHTHHLQLPVSGWGIIQDNFNLMTAFHRHKDEQRW